MCFRPLLEASPARRRKLALTSAKNYSFIHLPPHSPNAIHGSYPSECQIHRDLRRIANWRLFCQAKRLPTNSSGNFAADAGFAPAKCSRRDEDVSPGEPMETDILSLIQPVERM
jgi:hypothetical protein